MNVPLLTADEARQAREAFDAGRPWVKIEPGDYSHMSNRIPTVGRQVYVAPSRWADLDKPCDTCGGREWTFHPNPYLGAFMRGKHCPDCRDGRQVWELRTECPACRGRGTRPSYRSGLLATRDIILCPDCDADYSPLSGSVLVARVTIQVVPVVDLPPTTWPKSGVVWSAPNAPHPLLMRYQAIEDREWSMECQLPLNPLPVPGRDFGVVLREAK